MSTDPELDARLAAAAGVRDADLPALPEGFLAVLRDETVPEHRAAPGTPAGEPASVISARQLVTDAVEARTSGRVRRRPRRRAVLRAGAAVLVVAAAWTTAVLVDTPGGGRTPEATPSPTAPAAPGTPTEAPLDPPGGLTLVAAEAVTFPYSLDPAPTDLTPVLTRTGGLESSGSVEPVVLTARYSSADDPGFAFSISTRDPREQLPGAWVQPPYREDEIVEATAVSVDGAPADFVRAALQSPACTRVPAAPTQEEPPQEVCSNSFAQLVWQRSDGQWVDLWGRGDDHSSAGALVAVAESIVDRPQPVRLQFGLAPEGWVVSSYESLADLTLVSEADPTSLSDRIGISLLERWRGPADPDDVLQGMAEGDPVEQVTVQGRPAALVSVPASFADPGDGRRTWYLAAESRGGPLFLLEATDLLSREDVLAIAERVTYLP